MAIATGQNAVGEGQPPSEDAAVSTVAVLLADREPSWRELVNQVGQHLVKLLGRAKRWG
ncbi:hypothetical protein [Micromonospora qiuiae]|uniref:hypothetical protein n=1 Tax=Micromonospora qiuiae TaxID=502268 RepID=UPI00195101B1|nr:hypothetical protein [Micromonospora qiuiae]